MATYGLRLSAQPIAPCAAAAAPHHTNAVMVRRPSSCHSGLAVACKGGSVETDQANSITGSRLLGSPVSPSSYLPPTHSIP